MSEGVVVNPIVVDGKTVLLLHVPGSYPFPIETIINLADALESKTGHRPILVRGGHPSPGTAGIAICRKDDATMRAVEKIVRNAKPGAIIPLEDDEFDAVTTGSLREI